MAVGDIPNGKGSMIPWLEQHQGLTGHTGQHTALKDEGRWDPAFASSLFVSK